MQHTLKTITNTITPKTVIDKLFDYTTSETISSELLESYLLYASQYDASDAGTMHNFKQKLTILNRVIAFINELEKLSKFSEYKLEFPADHPLTQKEEKDLKKLIETFYLNNDARAITFEIWDNYVSAVGNDDTKEWSVSKHSNIAFTTLHLNTCLLDLEFFKQPVIGLS